MIRRRERQRSELGLSRPQLRAKRKRVSFAENVNSKSTSVRTGFISNFFELSKGFMTPARKKKLRVSESRVSFDLNQTIV